MTSGAGHLPACQPSQQIDVRDEAAISRLISREECNRFLTRSCGRCAPSAINGHHMGREAEPAMVSVSRCSLLQYPTIRREEATMAAVKMAAKKTARGRAQDRAKVAGGQKYEVS